MCNPVLLAVGSAGMNIMGAVQGHQAQKIAHQVNKRNALQGLSDEFRQINLQQGQEDIAASEKQIATSLETDQLKARALVAEGESGAVLNNNMVLQDMERQGLMAETGIARNFDNTLLNLQEERLGAKTKATSRINQVSKPSSTATGLKIGQAIVGGMQDSGKFT